MPEWTRDPIPKTQTALHRRLHDVLLLAGYDVEDEVQAGPYSLDCYVREVHVGFEADGRDFHQGKRDAARDDEILRDLSLPVVRFSEAELRTGTDDALVTKVIEACAPWADTASTRLREAGWDG